jgi:hypothetical protein
MDEEYGHGLADVLEIQKRFNELDCLMWRQQLLGAGENPNDRLKHIMETREEFSRRVDKLLEQLKVKP